MSDEPSLLRSISEEEGDPGLFPAEVHRLFEAGRPREARKALQKHIPLERDEARRDRQMVHAEDLYLWLEPLSGAPRLFTINGIGLRLHGRHRPDAHGNAIAVRYLTLLFIPLCPISAYVVRESDDGDDELWFRARAPLPLFARVWQMGFALVAVLLGIGAAAWVHNDQTHTDVFAYNGSPLPMQMQVGDRTVEVPPTSHVKVRRLPAAPTVLAASASVPGGTPVEIERLEVDLSGLGGEDIVYNAAGLGVFYTGYIQYGEGEPPDGFLLGAESVIEVDHDYVLRDPPESVSLRRKDSDTRSMLQPLTVEEGWTASERIGLLTEEVSLPDAVDHARAWIVFDPSDSMLQSMATIPYDGEAARSLQEQVGKMLHLFPDSVDAHRLAQDVELGAGTPPADLVARYAERAAAAPDSPDAAYLHARVLSEVDPEAARQLWSATAERHPDHGLTRRELAMAAMHAEQVDEALAHFDAFSTDRPDRLLEFTWQIWMLQRVAAGTVWSPALEARIDKAVEAGHAPFDAAHLRRLHRAAARSGTLEEIIARYEEEAAAAGAPPLTDESRASITAYTAVAGGWQADGLAALAELDAAPEPSRYPAQWRFLLALSDGGDRRAVGPALEALGPEYELNEGLLPVILAALRRVDAEEAAERVRWYREDMPSDAPLHVLAPELDLRDAAAVRRAVDAVDPMKRGSAWAAIAVALESEGAANHPVARQARAAARLWEMPGEGPYWAK